jgi:phosphatidylglycerophosphate synthase
MVAREFVVNGVRAAGAMQGTLVGSNWMGKTKTFLQSTVVGAGLLRVALDPRLNPPRGFTNFCYHYARWMAGVAAVAAAAFAAVFVYRNRALLRGTSQAPRREGEK